jgi:hypothetical protein
MPRKLLFFKYLVRASASEAAPPANLEGADGRLCASSTFELAQAYQEIAGKPT